MMSPSVYIFLSRLCKRTLPSVGFRCILATSQFKLFQLPVVSARRVLYLKNQIKKSGRISAFYIELFSSFLIGSFYVSVTCQN